ncbi:MAG: hypothetical protein ACJA1C_000559 [Crocinitomicaceae bacterium]|jgi:hypothetical protein
MGLFDRLKKNKKGNKQEVDNYFDGLPDVYVKFLDENPNGSDHTFIEHKKEDQDFEGRHWNLMGRTELLESWEMNGVGKARNFECLRLYIQVQKEYGQGEYTTSNIGKISLDRVQSGFVIGDENGDYLYLDSADNYSVWIYFHDGGDVIRIADSFEKFKLN